VLLNPNHCTGSCLDYHRPGWNERLNVWIDWNRDGDYDDSVDGVDEWVIRNNKRNLGWLSFDGGPAPLNWSQYVSVPAGTVGSVRMLTVIAFTDVDLTGPCAPLPPPPGGQGSPRADAVEVEQEVGMPRVTAVDIYGAGRLNYEDVPEAGGDVVYRATVTEVPAYEVECIWLGTGLPPNGLIGCTVTHQFDSNVLGPTAQTYGDKDLVLGLQWCRGVLDRQQRMCDGVTGIELMQFDYSVFWRRGLCDACGPRPPDRRHEPNWFRYWLNDGVVGSPGDGQVVYDRVATGLGVAAAFNPQSFPSLACAVGTGNLDPRVWGRGDGLVHFYPSALGARDIPNIEVRNPATCSIEAGLGGGLYAGVSLFANLMTHETFHRTTWLEANGEGSDPLTDTDRCQGPSGQDKTFADLIANNRETDTGTSTHVTDSCDLAGQFAPDYERYGDQELLARFEAACVAANGTRDWASPGMRASPASAGEDVCDEYTKRSISASNAL